jgi:hypothetical protein
MNQTKKSMPNLFTVTLPGANTEKTQEEEKLFDLRFSQKNKNLGNPFLRSNNLWVFDLGLAMKQC